MTVTTYLNELETERQEIIATAGHHKTPIELAEWWERVAEWWRKRDLGFGDGAGIRSHCLAMARKNREIATNE